MPAAPTRRQLLAYSAATAATLALTARAADAAKPLKALVLDHDDKWSHATGAADQLRAAGFVVEPLPLDRSPADLDADLIFLASFSTEAPGYPAYARDHAKDLLRFVERGKVLVQMAQADQTEPAPPFLPSACSVKRVDTDFPEALITSPDHPLAKGLPNKNGVFRWDRMDGRTIWESLADPRGFQVIIAAEPEAEHPALIEAAHGQGRILLCALDIDKTVRSGSGQPYGNRAQHTFAATFFQNLHQHVADVRNRRAPAVAVTPRLEPQPFVPGSWTLAVMPDTQVYALKFPGLFSLQARWILENHRRYNIAYTIQLGDITNNNTTREWERARDAMAPLWSHVPVAMVTGNHDHGPNGNATTRDTGFNTYFPLAQTAGRQPTFGGAMVDGDHQNTWHYFSAGNSDWIILCLEWAPRDEVVAWADRVMSEHGRQGGRRGILVTHAYMFNNDRRYDINDKEHPQTWNPHTYKTPGTKNDGEDLWQKLVRKHDFALTLNGHVLGDGTGYLASKTDKGRTCHQLLQTYQMRTLGGEAYLRLLEFHPDGKTVQVKTYSPLYDRYFLVPDQQFSFTLD